MVYEIEREGNRVVIRAVPKLPWYQNVAGSGVRAWRRLAELWRFRGLVYNLVARDLKVRYKNSALGVLWSLLNPLLMMVVFTAVFTVMRGQSVSDFPVFVLIGLLPWQFFANSVAAATGSVVGNAHLISKVYFPREALILSGVLSNFVNFVIALLVLFPIMALFHMPFTGWILLLPVVMVVELIFTLGVGFVVATTNVFYRDVQMIMDVILLAGFFLTPVFYSLDILPRSYVLFGVNLDVWRLMYYLNPMASIIANYRVILYSGGAPAADFLFRTLITSLVFLGVGLWLFYRYQSRFSEEL